jgi:UDP-N-acetylglucosamine 4,6-dehydratase/5-epimerase
MTLKGKKILITGGTGSLGNALTEKLLTLEVDTIRIYSRNEEKQIKMEGKFNDNRIRYFLGDIRDLERLKKAFEDVDIVFHAAALKHVPKIEYNPFEAIKTNVIGSQNVIDACLHENVEKAICIGTDKAVSPLNTYGASKLLMEKLFVTANNYLNQEKHPTKFLAVRYGNVLGSSGSVLPKFIDSIKKNKEITITDNQMTRFSILMDEALDLILNAAELGIGSEIIIPKLKAYTMENLKQALWKIVGTSDEKIIGIRDGEKLHEVLINSDEMRNVWEYKNMYLILNPLFTENAIKKYQGIKKIEMLEDYSSNTAKKFEIEELVEVIKKSKLVN